MNVPLGDTFYFKFTTRSFSTGAPTQLAGTPVISVYEENNLTQITAGITLTVDYDTVTGLNDVAIVATSGNGYEAGKYYDAVITTRTVGGVSVVGEVVKSFRIMAAENVAGVPVSDNTYVSGTAQTANDNGADINAILVDTAEIGTAGAGLTALAQASVCTETRLSELDAATAGKMANQVDIIQIDTTTDIPATIATAQADLDIITGADGAILAGTQPNSLSLQPITITAGDAINNITLAGSGTSDGIAFTRSGSGDPFDANFIGQINATVDTALTDYDAATGTELAAVDTKIDTIDTNVDAILVDTASIGITKNATYSNFEFLMVDATDFATPETGLTVTGQRSIDGGAFAAVTGTIAEVGSGIYQFDAAAADTNGDTITWKFAATGAADQFFTFKTRA